MDCGICLNLSWIKTADKSPKVHSKAVDESKNLNSKVPTQLIISTCPTRFRNRYWQNRDHKVSLMLSPAVRRPPLSCISPTCVLTSSVVLPLSLEDTFSHSRGRRLSQRWSPKNFIARDRLLLKAPHRASCGPRDFGNAADSTRHRITAIRVDHISKIPNMLLIGQGDVIMQLLKYGIEQFFADIQDITLNLLDHTAEYSVGTKKWEKKMSKTVEQSGQSWYKWNIVSAG